MKPMRLGTLAALKCVRPLGVGCDVVLADALGQEGATA